MARSALLLASLLAGAQSDSAPQEPDRPIVHAIRVTEAITPITTHYVTRGIAEARERGSAALLIELNTPGGLLEATQDIVQALFAAEVPIVVYVSPDGARAASAGTFITMAAHVAAMAPSTTIGAASPVSLTGGAQDSLARRKLLNHVESFIRTITKRRDRNEEWAVAAVREGASATEREALELGVIDVIAPDREELLREIDGRDVAGAALRTAGAAIEEIPKTLAEQVLTVIVRPEMMLILMLVAIYGIVGELTNPGAIVPGVAGVVALVLLLYASAAMPINVVGYVLVGLGILLFIAEAFTPTFGLLLGAGAVSFFLGTLILFQDLPEPLAIPWPWLVPATLLTTAFFVWVAGAGLKAQFAPVRMGRETMIGRRVRVVDRVSREGGRVLVGGEYWNAVSDVQIAEGEPCEIERVDGLTLKVKPVAEDDSSPT